MASGRVTTEINGGLRLTEYREGIRFGTDALLLADFAMPRLHRGVCADFGTGSGVLPLLLAGSGCRADFLAVELQEKYACLASENAAQNGLSDCITVLQGDLRQFRTLLAAESVAAVISNPPYLPRDCGRKNLAVEKRVAWHEECLSADELAAAASWALQYGGRFFCVYLPSRLPVLLSALRANGLEPKRLQSVVPSHGEAPSLVLLEAKKNASAGMEWLPALPLYTDASHTAESESLQAVYARFGPRKT